MKCKRPKLAKLYRSYLSEVVAVINGNACCSEINIVGDCVSAIFNTPYKQNINSVFSTSAQVSSIIKILNCKYKKFNIDPISVGIGMDYGRALMVKAGYKGSGINDVIWMGKVVNNASNLCGYGNKEYSDRGIMVSEAFYNNLNDHNKGLLEWNSTRCCYHGNIIIQDMQDWVDNNCS